MPLIISVLLLTASFTAVIDANPQNIAIISEDKPNKISSSSTDSQEVFVSTDSTDWEDSDSSKSKSTSENSSAYLSFEFSESSSSSSSDSDSDSDKKNYENL